MIELYIFILGLFFGSFLNVLADRLPEGRTLLGRSECDTCHHKLSWNDLIPVISFIEIKGKCRYCKAPLSIQYPLSELFTAVIFLLTWILSNQWYHELNLHIIHISIAAVLIVMVLSDIRYQIIPDSMQGILLLLGVFRLISLGMLQYDMSSFAWLQYFGWAVLHGLIVMSPLLAVHIVTKGRGMGFGDVKFAFIIGFILGLWSGLGALYIGFLLGGVIGAILILTRKGKPKSKIAFGPFLILGFYIMLFFEHDVIYWIGKIYGF